MLLAVVVRDGLMHRDVQPEPLQWAALLTPCSELCAGGAIVVGLTAAVR